MRKIAFALAVLASGVSLMSSSPVQATEPAQVIIHGTVGQPMPTFPGNCDTSPGGSCSTEYGSISCEDGCTVTNDGLDAGWWEVDNGSGSYLVDPDGNIYGAP